VNTAHKVRPRTGIQQIAEIQWIRGTSGTLGKVKNAVENDTTRGMASSLHTYFRGHTTKLVYRLGIVQRNYNKEDIATKIHNHFSFKHENPNINAALKRIRVIFIKEL
jgi:hypothetical protein